MKKIKNIALAGNPNSGKTTIFNNLTGANQRTGNYPGVTVEKRVGQARVGDYRISIVDLPGTYSMSAVAEDELVARNYILQDKPDAVVNVLDASNLYRNLYLTLQLIELEKPIVLALNMVDTAKEHGVEVSVERLKLHFPNIRVHTMIGSKNLGTKELLETLTEDLSVCPLKLTYGPLVEKAAEQVLEILKPLNLPADFPTRWLTLRLLENDMELCSLPDMPCMTVVMQESIKAIRDNLSKELNEDVATFISAKKYEYINHILKETVYESDDRKITISDRIDEVLTHKYFGLPIFLFFMWLLFNAVFTFGAYPQELIEKGVEAFAEYMNGFIVNDELRSLIVDGIIGGVGSVISFLPNILLLFLGISILEGTGYMSRAAFLMDRVMLSVGLHGKSFIPLLIGFGCTVPAIMGTRTLENKNDRIVTMLVSPFMSCSARLPVYTLLISAFFDESVAGTVLFGVYVFGVVTAILFAKLFRKTLFPGNTEPFIMEMPPYRMPTIKTVLLQMLERAMLYVKKAGTIILAASILVWFLTSNPQNVEYTQDYAAQISQLEQQYEQTNNEELTAEIQALQQKQGAEALEQSYAGMIGKSIEPVMAPLGFNWRISVGLLAAFSAKEVLVSALGTIYSVGAGDGSDVALVNTLQADPTLSPLVALSLMAFVLLYTPCLATIAIIYRETGGWKWPIFTGVYSLSVAWIASFIIFNVGRALGF